MRKNDPAQLSLPGMAETPARKRAVQRDDLPLLPQLNFSHSTWGSFTRCARYYYLQGPGAWGGWDDHAPQHVRRRYLRKILEGRFAWLGNRLHELIAQRMFSQIDAVYWSKTGVSPKSDEILRAQFLQRLRMEWNESRSLNWNKLLRHRRLKKAARQDVIWLAEHEEGKYPTGEFPSEPRSTEERRRAAQDEKAWNEDVLGWMKPSLDRIFSPDWVRIVGTLNVDRWCVIEGHRLKRGLIIPAPEDAWKSQLMLREGRLYPSQTLVVDGFEWKHFLTLDLLIDEGGPLFPLFRTMDHKSGRVDLQTGGARESAKDQVRTYLASLVGYFPGVTEENVVGQLTYLQYPPEEGIFESELALGEVQARHKETENRIRAMADRYVLLTEKTFPKLLPDLTTATAKALEKKLPEGQLVALKENFPAEAANRGDVSICRYCTQRSNCAEGKLLLKHSGLE